MKALLLANKAEEENVSRIMSIFNQITQLQNSSGTSGSPENSLTGQIDPSDPYANNTTENGAAATMQAESGVNSKNEAKADNDLTS